jgi:hypothetical protein
VRKPAQTALVVAAFAALAIFVTAELLNASGHNQFFLGDFHAFYCGGFTLAHGQNPYAAAPLMRCESMPQPMGLYATIPGLAVPAPFPGYVLALFAPFSFLPYPAAAVLWLALILFISVLAAIALADLTARPLLAVIAVFVTTFALIIFPLGQLTGIVLYALVAAAAALRKGKIAIAVTCLCFAALSPHVALGAFLAIFLWIKESRAAVLIAVFVLAVVDIAASGPQRALTYLTIVLPAHAGAEAGGALQYSLTWLVHAGGASRSVALRFGEACYIVMVCFGVVIAGMLARRFNDRAFVLLIPPAFALTGGTFVHLQEITLALPAALLLYSAAEQHGQRTTCTMAAVSLVLIAVPWLWVMDQPWIIVLISAVVFGIARGILWLDATRSLRASLGALGICACVMIIGARYGTQIIPKAVSAHAGALAQESWAQFVVNGSGITLTAAKAPTWIGLLLLAAACVYVLCHVNPLDVPGRSQDSGSGIALPMPKLPA